MTPAELDTRRRLLGLSMSELAGLGGVSDKTANRWVAGDRPVPGDVIDAMIALEDRMQASVDQIVSSLTSRTLVGPVALSRYRTQDDLDESFHGGDGFPLGAHAILIGWAADALEAEGIQTEIFWADMVG